MMRFKFVLKQREAMRLVCMHEDSSAVAVMCSSTSYNIKQRLHQTLDPIPWNPSPKQDMHFSVWAGFLFLNASHQQGLPSHLRIVAPAVRRPCPVTPIWSTAWHEGRGNYWKGPQTRRASD